MNTGAQLETETQARAWTRQWWLLGAIAAASVLLYWPAWVGLAHLVAEDEGHSHIAIVPFVSAWFLWNGRGDLVRACDRQSKIAAGIAIGLGVFGYVIGWFLYRTNVARSLSVWMLSLICFWVGCFLLRFGLRAARKAAFPLVFLLLMVPLPGAVLQGAILGLQRASAAVTQVLFSILRLPVYRHDFVFALPGISIEIARECSGIRSSISLMLTTLILGQLSLQSKLNKFLLAVAVVPIAVLKNGVRIVSLTLLSKYVDPSFLTGNLHHRGGFVFFLLALGLVLGLAHSLRAVEARGAKLAARRT